VKDGGIYICTPRDLNFQIDPSFNPISEDASDESIGCGDQCAKGFATRIDGYKLHLMFDLTRDAEVNTPICELHGYDPLVNSLLFPIQAPGFINREISIWRVISIKVGYFDTGLNGKVLFRHRIFIDKTSISI
jgi:hypothetical protein